MAVTEAWLVPWAPYGHCGGEAGHLSPVWPLWGSGRSPWIFMAPVGAWPLSWAPYGRCGGVAGPWDPYGCREGVVAPLATVWPSFRRGQSPATRMAAVAAWPVFWHPYGCRGGVASPLSPVLPPWKRAQTPGPGMAVFWLRGRTNGPRMAAVGAWPVPRAPYDRCWGVAGPLGHVWRPWERGRSNGHVWPL